MLRLILVIAFVLAVLGATAIMLLGPRAFAETRNVIVPRPTPALKTSKTLKRTWQTGPATIPPEEEAVPRRGAFPSPVKLFARESQPAKAVHAEGKSRQSFLASGSATPKPVVRVSVTTSPMPGGPVTPRVITTVDVARPISMDPDARARADLACLHEDPQARQAFYADLRHKAEQVRAGVPSAEPAAQYPCSAATAASSQR